MIYYAMLYSTLLCCSMPRYVMLCYTMGNHLGEREAGGEHGGDARPAGGEEGQGGGGGEEEPGHLQGGARLPGGGGGDNSVLWQKIGQQFER